MTLGIDCMQIQVHFSYMYFFKCGCFTIGAIAVFRCAYQFFYDVGVA